MSITHYEPRLGCDPEFFFVDAAHRVVGSERVLPEEGLKDPFGSKIVIDGVQAELNPPSSGCRESLASFIAEQFVTLGKRMATMNFPYTISTTSVVEVDAEELAELSPKARVFGCAPSFNLYNVHAKVGVDAATYRVRAAGGHIHLGSLPPQIWHDPTIHSAYISFEARDFRERLVPLLDLLVGNTCVLIDRDPGQAERRLHYGRAGEYRLPKHGLEYRTLSNFWLRHYVLMSFVFGMARLAVDVLGTTLRTKDPIDLEDALLGTVNFDKLITAINTNDAALARENFTHVEAFLQRWVPDASHTIPLSGATLSKFHRFLDRVQTEGLDTIFPEAPADHWRGEFAKLGGWESYLKQTY